MADENQRPDIEKFYSDPKYAKDREFFGALIRKELETQATASRAKPQPEANSIFDFLFWRPKSSEGDSVFDVLFGGRK